MLYMKENLSKRLFQLRKEKNISQQQLAKAVGATQKAVDFWEKGINEPKATYIINLAIFFGVSADYLLGLEE